MPDLTKLSHHWGTGPDAVTWPSAAQAGELEWQCRYGEPSRTALSQIASVLEAYHHLLTHPCEQQSNLATLRRLTRAQRNGGNDGNPR